MGKETRLSAELGKFLLCFLSGGGIQGSQEKRGKVRHGGKKETRDAF